MNTLGASQLLPKYQVAQKVMKATKAAGMNIIANCEEIARGEPNAHTHVHLVLLATVRTVTSKIDLSPEARLWQTCQDGWNQKCLGVAMRIIRSHLYLQELQPEVIWSQKSPSHTDEVLIPLTAFKKPKGRCKYYPKQPVNHRSAKNSSRNTKEDLTLSLRSWKDIRLD